MKHVSPRIVVLTTLLVLALSIQSHVLLAQSPGARNASIWRESVPAFRVAEFQRLLLGCQRMA